MPHLLDLEGRPLEWSELLRRNEAWWAVRRFNENGMMIAQCRKCSTGEHQVCAHIQRECACHDLGHPPLREFLAMARAS